MTAIGQINNLNLFNTNRDSLTVCENHAAQILQEISTTVENLVQRNATFKNIFERATSGLTDPYTIHFSENEITINNQKTSLTDTQASSSQEMASIKDDAKALLTKINKIYSECHPLPSPASSYPMQQPLYAPQPAYYPPMMSAYPPAGYYPPCQAYYSPQMPQAIHPHHHGCPYQSQSCTARKDTVAHVSSSASQSPCASRASQSPISESRSDSEEIGTPLAASRQTSTTSLEDTAVAPRRANLSRQPSTEEKASQHDSLSTIDMNAPDLRDQVISTRDDLVTAEQEHLGMASELFKALLAQANALRENSIHDASGPTRKALSEHFEQRAPGVANNLFFQMWLLAEKKHRDSSLSSQPQTTYERGKDLFAKESDEVSDDLRAAALEREVIKQIADELAICQDKKTHSALIDAYACIPLEIKHKAEAHVWELCGGDQNAGDKFGEQFMLDVQKDSSIKAEALRRYLQAQLLA